MTKGNTRGEARHVNCVVLSLDCRCLAWPAPGPAQMADTNLCNEHSKTINEGMMKMLSLLLSAWQLVDHLFVLDRRLQWQNNEQNTSVTLYSQPSPHCKINSLSKNRLQDNRAPHISHHQWRSLTTFSGPKSSGPQAGTSMIGSISITF